MNKIASYKLNKEKPLAIRFPMASVYVCEGDYVKHNGGYKIGTSGRVSRQFCGNKWEATLFLFNVGDIIQIRFGVSTEKECKVQVSAFFQIFYEGTERKVFRRLNVAGSLSGDVAALRFTNANEDCRSVRIGLELLAHTGQHRVSDSLHELFFLGTGISDCETRFSLLQFDNGNLSPTTKKTENPETNEATEGESIKNPSDSKNSPISEEQTSEEQQTERTTNDTETPDPQEKEATAIISESESEVSFEHIGSNEHPDRRSPSAMSSTLTERSESSTEEENETDHEETLFLNIPEEKAANVPMGILQHCYRLVSRLRQKPNIPFGKKEINCSGILLNALADDIKANRPLVSKKYLKETLAALLDFIYTGSIDRHVGMPAIAELFIGAAIEESSLLAREVLRRVDTVEKLREFVAAILQNPAAEEESVKRQFAHYFLAENFCTVYRAVQNSTQPALKNWCISHFLNAEPTVREAIVNSEEYRKLPNLAGFMEDLMNAQQQQRKPKKTVQQANVHS